MSPDSGFSGISSSGLGNSTTSGCWKATAQSVRFGALLFPHGDPVHDAPHTISFRSISFIDIQVHGENKTRASSRKQLFSPSNEFNMPLLSVAVIIAVTVAVGVVVVGKFYIVVSVAVGAVVVGKFYIVVAVGVAVVGILYIVVTVAVSVVVGIFYIVVAVAVGAVVAGIFYFVVAVAVDVVVVGILLLLSLLVSWLVYFILLLLSLLVSWLLVCSILLLLSSSLPTSCSGCCTPFFSPLMVEAFFPFPTFFTDSVEATNVHNNNDEDDTTKTEDMSGDSKFAFAAAIASPAAPPAPRNQ